MTIKRKKNSANSKANNSTPNGETKKRKLAAQGSAEHGFDSGFAAPDEHEEEEEEASKPEIDYENETADEKRVRLAKEYLNKLEAERALEEGDSVARQLEEDVQKAARKFTRKVALKLKGHVFGTEAVRILKGHQLPATCVVVSEDEQFAWTASKDSTIVKWNLTSCAKVLTIQQSIKKKGKHQKKGKHTNPNGHSGAVLTLALSYDGKFLASGGVDRIVRIWDAADGKHLHSFDGHRGAVTGLAFQRGAHQLFSCSEDRTVKIWNIDDMLYLDTLFGHQSEVTGIDSYHAEKCITVGTDRTVRVWKVVEGTQLIFKGHEQSIDAVAAVDEETFVTGSQDGCVAFWSTQKKKPTKEVPSCHGGALPWVCAVGALYRSDLVASGGSDGKIHLWQSTKASLSSAAAVEKINSIDVPGFVNGLSFAPSGNILVAAVGQEHRLGRWARIPKVPNGIAIIQLGLSKTSNNLIPNTFSEINSNNNNAFFLSKEKE